MKRRTGRTEKLKRRSDEERMLGMTDKKPTMNDMFRQARAEQEAQDTAAQKAKEQFEAAWNKGGKDDKGAA